MKISKEEIKWQNEIFYCEYIVKVCDKLISVGVSAPILDDYKKIIKKKSEGLCEAYKMVFYKPCNEALEKAAKKFSSDIAACKDDIGKIYRLVNWKKIGEKLLDAEMVKLKIEIYRVKGGIRK